MYLQSRTKRWLQALRNSNTQLHSAQATVATFAAAKDQGARVLGEQEHKVMTCLALDYMDLTLDRGLKPRSVTSSARDKSSHTATSLSAASTGSSPPSKLRCRY